MSEWVDGWVVYYERAVVVRWCSGVSCGWVDHSPACSLVDVDRGGRGGAECGGVYRAPGVYVEVVVA